MAHDSLVKELTLQMDIYWEFKIKEDEMGSSGLGCYLNFYSLHVLIFSFIFPFSYFKPAHENKIDEVSITS